MIPKRIERNTLGYFRVSAGKAWFHTPRLCRGTGSRLSDSGSRALPWGMKYHVGHHDRLVKKSN